MKIWKHTKVTLLCAATLFLVQGATSPAIANADQGRMGPPDWRMGPPDWRMGPPDWRVGPPDWRVGPPDWRVGPPDWRR